MAKIISVSLGEELLSEIDSVQKDVGFSGRSEAIRSGMKLLLDDLKEKEKLKGHAECVLVLAHDRKFEDAFTQAKHDHEDIISTQIHSNFCNNKCLEVFVLHGSADKIRDFFSEIRKNKRSEYVKLIVP
ncbi:MAG: CopG family ribbon-helix-helix protein [Candidatus Aenigmarchaeota archaeon]|nr:CopG family ribbon-helix-helix protein [Candidatus Aenigmarchaeota archaeon]